MSVVAKRQVDPLCFFDGSVVVLVNKRGGQVGVIFDWRAVPEWFVSIKGKTEIQSTQSMFARTLALAVGSMS